MITIQEMREKYWSGVKHLWPAKRSKVAVPFCWDGFKLNEAGMTFAKIFSQNGTGNWNEANYWLTLAYKGGPENDDFWNQFI